jgi:hypothetical protein
MKVTKTDKTDVLILGVALFFLLFPFYVWFTSHGGSYVENGIAVDAPLPIPLFILSWAFGLFLLVVRTARKREIRRKARLNNEA